MDEKYFWPLVAVVLGWFLTFVVGAAKDFNARRSRIGRLLSKLILVRSELRTLIAATDNYKNHADNFEDYERYRKGISDRHFLESEATVDALRGAVDDLSGDYPLHVIEFENLLRALLKIKKAALGESAKNKQIYLNVISMHEVTLDLCEELLVKHIRALAWMHSLLTYIRVRYMLRSSARLTVRNQSLLTKIAADLFGEIKKKRPVELVVANAPTPQPVSGTPSSAPESAKSFGGSPS